MAKDSPAKTPAPKKRGRLAQILDVYRQSKQVDPKIGWWMLLAFVGVVVVAVGVGLLLGAPVYAAILGIPLGLLAATIVMSRRAERAAYRQIEGQPGASGAALTALARRMVHRPAAGGHRRGPGRGHDRVRAGLPGRRAPRRRPRR